MEHSRSVPRRSICYNVLLKDTTDLSKTIHTRKSIEIDPQLTTKPGNFSTFFKPQFHTASVSYVFEGETIELSEESKKDDFTVVILDVNHDDASSVKNVTCLTSHWQVEDLDVSHWQFNDTQSDESHKIDNILLIGTQSELVVEDSDHNDLVPKNNLDYATSLVQLFTKRNDQLRNIMNFPATSN